MASVQQEQTVIDDKQLLATKALTRLKCVNLLPERYSHHMKVMTKLKQICRVQVSCATDKCGYVIEVFTPSQSITRIPTSIKSTSTPMCVANDRQHTTFFCKPESRVEKKFTEFVKLRDELYETAYPHIKCRFCCEVIRYLLTGAVLPGSLSTWMLPQRQRAKSVQRFLESLLMLAVACPVVEDANGCSCQETLPQLLFEVLFETVDPLAAAAAATQ